MLSLVDAYHTKILTHTTPLKLNIRSHLHSMIYSRRLYFFGNVRGRCSNTMCVDVEVIPQSLTYLTHEQPSPETPDSKFIYPLALLLEVLNKPSTLRSFFSAF